MGYSTALPKKPYLPALVSSSRTTSSARRRTSSAVKDWLSAGAAFSPRKDSSSRIEISAWSDRPLALAMASSFARVSGSRRNG